jgi:preprotein translocase subunit YajC
VILGKELIMDNMWVLAQAEQGQAPSRIGSEPVQTQGGANTVAPGEPAPPTGAQPRQPTSPWSLLFPLLLMAIFFYLMLFRGPRKQQQQHRQMVQSLEKNDRVRTIGGIFGTVMDVRGDEIVLKVDESNNTKIRISASAVNKNLTKEGKE